ncbi:MAG: hypothetical protein ACTS6G_05055 [Candidatus Hodgkinia cicadicola]
MDISIVRGLINLSALKPPQAGGGTSFPLASGLMFKLHQMVRSLENKNHQFPSARNALDDIFSLIIEHETGRGQTACLALSCCECRRSRQHETNLQAVQLTIIPSNEKQPFANQTCFEFPRSPKHDVSNRLIKHHVWFFAPTAELQPPPLGGLNNLLVRYLNGRHVCLTFEHSNKVECTHASHENN